MCKKNRDIQLTFMLLRTFCTRQDLSAILNLGYSYETIACELERCIKDNDIVDVNGKLQITEKGIKKSSDLVKFLKKQKKGWIDPEYESKIEQIDINFIYLPMEKDWN